MNAQVENFGQSVLERRLPQNRLFVVAAVVRLISCMWVLLEKHVVDGKQELRGCHSRDYFFVITHATTSSRKRKPATNCPRTL